MVGIDSALLNLTERWCRRVQRLTGRTNVWLAFHLTNLSIIVYFLGLGVHLWTNAGAPRLWLALFCAALLYLLSQTIFRVPLETYENSAYARVAKGVRNPRRLRDVPLRLPFLTLSILLLYPIVQIYLTMRLLIVVLTYALVVLTTVVLYLLACDPLPPCTGKVREWWRALAARRSERLSESA
jgi:hypothetical protein